MTFQELINKIENKIGNEVTRTTWKAKLLSVTERHAHAIRIEVLFSLLDDSFSFTRELKISEINFTDESRYNDEIVRYVKRLDDYSAGIAILKVISDPPNINNKWKGYITNLAEKNPIHSIMTVTYSTTGMTFEKEVHLRADDYISRQFINNQIDDNVIKLNIPLELPYYQNLIN